MTFDARKGSPAPTSGRQNMLFAGATFAIVCGAFFTVLSLPRKGEAPPRAEASHSETIAAAVPMPRLPGEAAEVYFVALGRIDTDAQSALSRRIGKAGKLDDHDLADLVLEHASDVLKAHAGELAMADTRHLDDLLDLARDRLRAASRKRSKWCEASRYADLRDIEFSDPEQLQREMSEFEAPMRDFAFEALTGLMAAVEDARVNPVTRGALTRADQAALQGMVMSIMADPDVMPLIISLKTDADARQALKGVNACDLAATAVIAAKTLPQDTKGRLLAEAMKNVEKNGLGAFATGVGF